MSPAPFFCFFRRGSETIASCGSSFSSSVKFFSVRKKRERKKERISTPIWRVLEKIQADLLVLLNSNARTFLFIYFLFFFFAITALMGVCPLILQINIFIAVGELCSIVSGLPSFLKPNAVLCLLLFLQRSGTLILTVKPQSFLCDYFS